MQNSHPASPGAEKTDADFAVFVKVWIEAVGAKRNEEEHRRGVRIIIRELNVEKEQTIFIGGSSWTLNHHREEILVEKRKIAGTD